MTQAQGLFRVMGLLLAVLLVAGCGAAALTPEQALDRTQAIRTAVTAGQWQEAGRLWPALHDALHGGLLAQLPAADSQSAHLAVHRLEAAIEDRDQPAVLETLAELDGWLRQISQPGG